MRVRIPAALAVAMLSLSGVSAAGIARASAAAPVTPPDTVKDAKSDVPVAQDDLLGAGFVATSTSLVFGMRVNVPTDPATDPAWMGGRAFMNWQLDTDGDGQPDHNIMLIPDGAGGMSVSLSSPTNFDICDGTGTYIASYGYTASFAKSCLPSGLAFRFQAIFTYTADPPPAPQNDSDFAPDGFNKFGPVVRTPSKPVPPVNPTGGGKDGYWMLGSDGHVYPFGAAVGFPGLQQFAVAMTPRADGKGYWVVDAFGRVLAHGAAVAFAGSPQLRAGEQITTIAATHSGNGYWLFSNQGRVFAFGDAHRYGDLASVHLNGPIVASTATASGHGYYMVGRDGGIFAFGDARFHGSTGAMRLNRPIVGMSPTPAGTGYWLVASDGGVFAFNAPFRGSMGGTHLNRPVNGLVAFGTGYLMVSSDGGVFDFSNRAFEGSLAAHPPAAPIIGLAAFSR